MKKITKCIKCGFPKHGSSRGIIWLSKDGYCSVCNAHFKERNRPIDGMDKFVKTSIVKEGENLHLDTQGRKLTNARVLNNKITMSNKSMNIPMALRKAKNKGKKKIDDFT